MSLRNKVESMKVEKVLSIVFICFIVSFTIYMKILGATDVGVDVEKNGYCKQYGEYWKNKRGENICYHKSESPQNIKPIEFTEEEFRNYCPKNKFFSTKFSNDCWKISGSIA